MRADDRVRGLHMIDSVGSALTFVSGRSTAPYEGRRDTFPVIQRASFLEDPVMNKTLTAIIEREGDGYVALCPSEPDRFLMRSTSVTRSFKSLRIVSSG